MERPYIIISDVHGDNNIMEMIREKEKRYNALGILSAGDLCPEKYNPLYDGILTCNGNCDREYQYEIFPPDHLKLNIFSHNVYITHSDRYSPSFFHLCSGDIFISGHTHIPKLYKGNGIYFINPGSPSEARSSLGPTFVLFFPSHFDLISLFDNTTLSALSISLPHSS